MNACGSEIQFWKERTSSTQDARRQGCSGSASSHPAALWWTLTGGFRMVRTIKRAIADDRWKVVSPRDPFSAADLESTPAEFTCSGGTRGEVNPAAQRLKRHPVDALPPNPDHDPVPRRLYLKQRDFRHMGRRITARVADHWSVVAVHKATLRNVDFALKESLPVFALQPVLWVMLPRGVR